MIIPINQLFDTKDTGDEFLQVKKMILERHKHVSVKERENMAEMAEIEDVVSRRVGWSESVPGAL